MVVTTHLCDDRRAEVADKVRRVIARRFGIQPSPVLAASSDDIPLTAAGKLRRFELADRIRSGQFDVVELSSPSTAMPVDAKIETRLEEIWREIMGIEGHVDREASFFDLGGDSLRSILLQTAVEQQFATQISPEEFFKAPTFDTHTAPCQ